MEFESYEQALADYLGVSEDDIVFNDDYMFQTYTVNVDDEEQEYFVGTEEEAHQASVDRICELYDEIGDEFLGLKGVKEFVYYGIDEDALREWYVEDTENWLYDCEESELEDRLKEYGFDVEEIKENEEDLEDYIPELAERIVDGTYDIVEELEAQLGDDYFWELLEQNGWFYISELADRLTNFYGPANELASYDGDEIELGDYYTGEELYAYRIS